MTALRFFAIILIFGAACLAWMILGGTIEFRTRDLTQSLSQEVSARWGPPGLVQSAPSVLGSGGGVAADPLKSTIEVHFDQADRYMGLIWFSTYTVDFSGTYLVSGSGKYPPYTFVFDLPDAATGFENLTVTVDEQPLDMATAKAGNKISVPLPQDDRTHAITVAYRTQARDRWLYDLSRSRDALGAPIGRLGSGTGEIVETGPTAMIRNFTLTATTNFTAIDYPKGTVSPTPRPAEIAGGGATAVWHFENRNTRERIGIEMPARVNAGPLAARMAFYAPVSLFFFFTVMFTIVALKKIPLHPMHYLFIAAGFFSFHILMAYLVDKIGIHETFWICAAVSVLLVTSYMRLVAGMKFAVLYAGAAQLVYLIGFSYAFFWTGWTGLTIVIVAIITLFVLMQATGRVNWNEVFAAKPPKHFAPRPAGPAPTPPAAGPPPPAKG